MIKVVSVKGVVINIGKKDLILNAHGVDSDFKNIGNRFSIVRIPMMSITGMKQAKFNKETSKTINKGITVLFRINESTCKSFW